MLDDVDLAQKGQQLIELVATARLSEINHFLIDVFADYSEQDKFILADRLGKVVNSKGMTALHVAAVRTNEEVFDLLVKQYLFNINPLGQGDFEHKTPLDVMIAARQPTKKRKRSDNERLRKSLISTLESSFGATRWVEPNMRHGGFPMYYSDEKAHIRVAPKPVAEEKIQQPEQLDENEHTPKKPRVAQRENAIDNVYVQSSFMLFKGSPVKKINQHSPGTGRVISFTSDSNKTFFSVEKGTFECNNSPFTLFSTSIVLSPEISKKTQKRTIDDLKNINPICSSPPPNAYFETTITRDTIVLMNKKDRVPSQKSLFNQGKRQNSLTGPLNAVEMAKEYKYDNDDGQDWQFLHIIGFSLGGLYAHKITAIQTTEFYEAHSPQQLENMFIGTKACNGEMLVFESIIRNLLLSRQVQQVQLKVKIEREAGTHMGKRLGYTIVFDKLLTFTLKFNPKSLAKPVRQYFYAIEDAIVKKLLKVKCEQKSPPNNNKENQPPPQDMVQTPKLLLKQFDALSPSPKKRKSNHSLSVDKPKKINIRPQL